MDSERLAYLEERIAAKKALLLKWETALDEAISSGVQEYTFDDNQGRQTVRKFNVISMRKDITSLENEIMELEARAYGYGSSLHRGS